MLSVLLLILKIIGIILLAILGIVLLVLIVPIFYKVDIDLHDGEFDVKVKAHWLKVVISFFLEYQKEVSYRLRIFGIKAVESEEDQNDYDSPKDEETDSLETESTNVADDPQKDDYEHEVVDESKTNSVSEDDGQLDSESEDVSKDRSLDKSEINQETEEVKIKQSKKEKKAEKAELKQKKKEQKAKDKEEKKKARAKKKEEKARRKAEGDTFFNRIKSNKYVKIVRDDSFKPALSLTWKLLKKTLRHILPRRLKGQIFFGIDNPALLGQMYGFIALVFGPTGRWLNKLTIVPDFVNTGADVSARLKGRITIGVLLFYFLRLYFNKDVKRVRKMYKQDEDN